MKRFMVSALATLLSLTGCSSKADAVRFQVAADGAEVAAYQQLVDAFHAQSPGEEIDLIAVGSHGDHMAKLASDFAVGEPADVFLVNYRRFGQLARNGAILPASTFIDEVGIDLDDFYERPIDAFTVDGDLMCMPQNISSLAVYYNKALFAEAKVAEPSGDWTWDDFLETAKQLTQDTDSDGPTDIYGLATETSLVRLAAFVWQAGGDVVDDVKDPSQTTLLGDAEIEAASYFINLRRKHKIAPSLEEAEAEDPESRFARGGAAMLLDSRRATANLRTAENLEFDVAPMPQYRQRATVLHSDAYCIAASSSHAQRAKDFIAFAMSEEGQALLSKSGRIVPVRKSVATSEAFLDPTAMPKNSQVWLDQESYVRTLPNISAWNEIESLTEPIIEEWFYGTEPPENLGIEIDIATRALFTEEGAP